MTRRARLSTLGLAAGGLLWGGSIALDFAGADFPVLAFVLGLLLVGLTLPAVTRRGDARSPRLVRLGTVLVLTAIGLWVLFGLQLVLLLADLASVGIGNTTMDLGRRAMVLAAAVGVLALAAGWHRAREDTIERLALAVVGVAGLGVTFVGTGRLLGSWLLALGALWLFLGLAAWLDTRGGVAPEGA